ncbi:hypothetical protein KSW81_002382 [Nannochloris sp. 'desiccata']|nr:hypothetical protein KSW81_002382 [Chlorella desiccata (nom. nud.)]
MEPNGVTALAKSPPQEGPYSVRKQQSIHGLNSGYKGATPGGSFIDRMRTVLHKTTGAGCSAEKASAGKSSSGHGSVWGDTPDTAEMEYIAQMEREALRQRLENSAGLAAAAAGVGNELAGQRAPPTACAGPRQLLFSPVIAAADSLGGEIGFAGPGSGRLRSMQKRQLSHLGRTSLASSAVVAAETRPLPTPLQQPQIEVVTPHDDAVLNRVSVGAVRPPEVLRKEYSGGAKRQKVGNNNKVESKVHLVVNYSRLDDGCELSDSSDDDEDQKGRSVEDITTTAAAPPPPPPLELRTYLSPEVAEAILRIGGPETLYQWQAECLCRPGVLQGRNLVYCAPTSGGKSLVADIIFLRRFVETRRPGLLVLPFISLCNEKKSYWDNVLQPLDREAREYYGPTSTSAPIGPRTGLIVATLEKANHLITQLLEENALGMLSCVIIDELHMVGDEHRGYQLELMLTKLRFAGAAAFEEEEQDHSDIGRSGGVDGCKLGTQDKEKQWFPMMGLEEGTQIIGMSATLPNVSVVASWLGAELFTTEFRPVPLRQYIKSGNLIKDEFGTVVRAIPDSDSLSSRFNVPCKELQAKDPDHVAFLAQETVDEGFSVLVFCATRGASEATATLLSQLLEVPERHIKVKRDVLTSTASKYGLHQVHRASIAAEIGRLSSSHSKKLSALVASGVGYHHAGMEPDDKELIELAFKCGAISVLCATSSLAAGVNLPARRVIFRHPYIGRATNYLDAANYRQMRGRAGRAGIDTHGESFLLVLQKSTEKSLAALMHAESAPVESCLTQDKCGMKRAMLEVVASGAVISPSDVDRYIKCTLLASTSKYEVVMNATKEALKWLGDKERQFIYWDKKTETFQPTAFGKAALGSGLPPELCLGIRSDIARARQSFVLTTELHLAYLCVPATEDKSINFQWQRFELLLKNLPPSEKIVADKVGINMDYVLQKSRSFNSFIGANSSSSTTAASSSTLSSSQQDGTKATLQQLQTAMSEQDRICQRFGTALLLSDILQEMSSQDIHAKYGLDRAVVLGLRDRACRYAGMLAVFCERLGWHDVELLVSKFQARVLYGVRPEVVCLMEIDHVQAATARMLYKAGLRTPEAVAAVADVQRVISALAAGRGGAETMNGAEKGALVQQARKIVSNAKKLMKNRAKKLKEDAAEALQLVENLNQGVADICIGFDGTGGGILEGITGGVNIASVQQQQQQQRALDGRAEALLAQLPSPLNTFITTTASLSTGSPTSLPPDLWEFGRTSGLITLSTTAHVQALKNVLLEGKYTTFAFQFAILQISSMHAVPQQGAGSSSSGTGINNGGWSVIPSIPFAAASARAVAPGRVAVGQPQQPNIGGVALSWRENQAFYIPFTKENPQLPQDAVLFELAELFNDARFEKITFNVKGQLTSLHRASVSLSLPALSTLAQNIAAPIVDIRIAAFLLDPEDDKLWDCVVAPSIGSTSNGSTNLHYGSRKKASYYFNAESLSASLLGPVAVATATRSLPPLPPQQQQYGRSAALYTTVSGMNGSLALNRSLITTAGRNAILLNACYPPLRRELQLKGLYDLFLNIEMPLVSILSSMEEAGVGVDPGYLQKEMPVLRHRLTELENLAERCLVAPTTTTAAAAVGGSKGTITAGITNVATRSINMNSSEECAEALYTTLQLAPPPSAQRCNNGKTLSTKAEQLEELAAAYPNCPLPRIISEYRTITKLLATCVEMRSFCTVNGW